jgi:hypothetical protein
MSDFDYSMLIAQIRNKRDTKERKALLEFIGEKGDDRFIEPLSQLIKIDDSPELRLSLYSTFTKIGSELADEVIKKKIKASLPKDDGKKVTKKEWKEAVAFLTKNLEQTFIDRVDKTISQEGRLWAEKNQGGMGIFVRNLLRNNGFDWGESALKTYWSWVLEDALNELKK